MNFGIDWIKAISGNGTFSGIWFVPFAILVLIAAMRLVKFSEVIIVKTKFGGAFIGGVLIATVTSIPELISEITQAVDGHPAASVSNELGSNAFSAFLIAITVVMMYKTPFLEKLGRFSRITMFASALMSFFISIFMFTESDVSWGFPHAVIGIIPLLTFLMFCVMLYVQYRSGEEDEDDGTVTPNVSVKSALWRILFWSILLVVFSLSLNFTVDTMMESYNIGANSAGGIFLAFAGSLPEMVAFIILVKKKRYVSGIAALVGSHLFNLGITFFGDLAYHDASYYTNGEMSSAAPLAIIAGVMMLGLGLQALFSSRMNSKLRLVIPSLCVVGYILGWVLMITLL